MLTFVTLRIEGGLFSPDLFDDLDAGRLPGQKPADFGLPPHRLLTEEIAALYHDARALWRVFQNRLQRLPEDASAVSETRELWLIPLLRLLGYDLRYAPQPRDFDGLSLPISHYAGAAEHAPPAHLVGIRQELGRVAPAGRPRLSPHSLLQECLNRSEALWGLVSNGRALRLLRDSTFLRRQCYVEFDLQRLMEEEHFADFALFYRLLHRTRLPADDAAPEDCLLERYYQQSLEQGGRVRERLREGVEEAIVRLANGFLAHPANDALRQKVAKWRMANGEGGMAKGEGPLSAHDFYRQLLRLVYRFLFLLVAEQRGLMDRGERAGRPYEHYGVSRLRRLCERLSAYTDDSDLWASLCALWAVLADEKMAAVLGAPPLNGDLFARQDLDNAHITNRDLLSAFWHLAFYDSPPRRINYAALDTEELGSVYESLLDYQPVVEAGGGWRVANGEWRTVRGVRFTLAPGSERKSTGSYYTPSALVEELVNSALAPVIKERLAAAERMANGVERMANGEAALSEWRMVPKPVQERFIHEFFPRLSRPGGVGARDVDRATGVSAEEKELALAWQATPPPIRYSLFAEHALLSIKVLDPACGSGHFLLAAARRLGKELARVRTGEDEPAPERLREAIRDVVAHCIYGVDKNPLAVELCRVALWLESHAEGKPLTFLDHRIKCGDSLVGVLDLETLRAGLPDEAFEPVSGDDRKLAAGLKKRNRQERSGQLSMFNAEAALDLAPLAAAAARLEAIPDDAPADVRRKDAAYKALLDDPRRKRLKDACDLWTAAFFQRMANGEGRVANGEGRVGNGRALFITSEAVNRVLAGDLDNPQLLAQAQALAAAHPFFHWPLEFPEVFATAGFDVILGNPPWERIKLQDEEFFANRDAEIAKAPNAAARKRRIAELPKADPSLWAAYQDALHAAESASRFLRGSGVYPLTGRGDINTYSVFAERARGLLGAQGRAGLIVPTGIATDATNQFFFADLVAKGQLVSLFDFENREGLFPGVHRSYKFCLLTLAGGRMANGQVADDEGRMANGEGQMADGESSPATFAFFATRAEHLRDPRRLFTLTADEIARINPNTRTLPVFRTRQDAALTKAIYARVPVLVQVANGEVIEGEWRMVEGEWRMVDGSPFAIRHSPFAICHSLFAICHSPFANPNPWGVRFLRMFDMSNDSGLFRTRAELEAEGYRLVGNACVKGDPDSPSAARYLPLYEAKMIWHYDHRYGSYAGVRDRGSTQLPTPDAAQHADPCHLALPWYWAPAEEVQARLGDWRRGWLIGFRDVARSTDERTAIFTLLPRAGVGHTMPIFLVDGGDSAIHPLSLLANLNFVTFDWVLRQKIGGTHLTLFILRQLPVLPPDTYTPDDLRFIVPRALELVYTAWDIKPFADDVWREAASGEANGGEALRAAIRQQWEANRAATGGVSPAPPEWLPLYGIDPAAPCPLPPFKWDEGRRALLRAELDAYYARLYGLTRKQLRYILDPADLTARELADILDPWEEVGDPLDAAGYAARAAASDFPGETFRVLKEKEQRQYGEYRTRRLVLAAWETARPARPA